VLPNPSRIPQVLCVDDQPANLRLLEAFLADIGVAALLAHSGEEALDILTECPVDLIFMDVQMPGMDGRQVTSELRRREEIAGFGPVPIVAVTADALESERRQLLQCGMNDYLTKPITAEQLRQTVNKWTGMLTHEGEPVVPPLSTQHDELTEPEATSPTVLDHEEGLRLAAGKADLARDMLQMLLRDLPETARRVVTAGVGSGGGAETAGSQGGCGPGHVADAAQGPSGNRPQHRLRPTAGRPGRPARDHSQAARRDPLLRRTATARLLPGSGN